jgi:hypothetical protein
MSLSDNAKKELREILIEKGITLDDIELEKCGLFYLTLIANSLKIKLNL